MTNDRLLEELKKELRELKEEVRQSRGVQFIPQPYPVFVPHYPHYPSYPWWGTGTVIIGNTPPTGTATWTTCNVLNTTTNAATLQYSLTNGSPQA